MMSAPASSQRRIWSIVALASSVGVLVMVWTLIGASPPTGTEPTMICRDLRRSISRQGRMDMGAHIGASVASAGNRRGRIRATYPHCVNRVNGTRWGRPMAKLARLPADRSRARSGRGRRAPYAAPADPILCLPQLQPQGQGARRLAPPRARAVPRSRARWPAG